MRHARKKFAEGARVQKCDGVCYNNAIAGKG